MINIIRFNNVNPNIFAGSPPEGEPSEVWNRQLSFEKGKSYLIEAASGRGKTSFCSFLFGLRNDFQGRIELLDAQGKALNINERSKCDIRRLSIAMMFQEHRLFPELTALENVMLKNQLTNHLTEAEIRSMLTELGLKDRIDTPCARLSFGQQQRVAFVRLLAQPADFLILDEPISHLDIDNANIIGNLLARRQAADGAGIIVTSIGHRLPYNYDKVIKL